MLVVHHLNNSRSQRILWLLEELELPYEIRFYKRDPKTMRAPPELKRVHLLGKAPVLVDGDVVLPESGAIIEYVLKRYGNGRLMPAEETSDWVRFVFWLHYAEGSAMPPLLLKLIFQMLPEKVPFLLRPLVRKIASETQKGFVDPQLRLNMDFWESELAKTGWFAGADLSGADIQMSFPLEAAASRAGALLGRPNVRAFLERIHARPAYRRAIEKGGPYAYAKP
ncbi:glutathione S-transferase [Gluconobacter oxydans]|uniref:glutathione S-transferase n=1 Tax=Gluconobacter oxydans TaxID=442 RepID=UPI000780D6F1|nr:glutathione S-transferase [Gluconobacter oxydans]KXV11899.1 glutathione S-transferase [Gluconobacter oxydans]MCP1248077.1 glutathione S-transferase [Gluconobacter oxydans]WKE47756.1 glutathione S-transferase [Gluconobacter oxydans]